MGPPSHSFSGGMRRLVAFCMAAVVPGRIVILDEPTNDIGPLRRRLLWEQVRLLVELGSAVLLVTRILRSYGLMLKWQALSSKTVLPITLIVQLMIAAGFIIGIGFFYPEMTPETAKYLTTGAPTITLLMVGVVVVPQMVAMARSAGTFDYMWSQPVPRLVYVAADATVWVLVSLPGVVLSLILGAVYFDFALELSWLAIPAVLLISLTGVMYPASQLPGWMEAIHRFLPVLYMADLSRGTLTDLEVDIGRAFAVVGAWCVLGLIVTTLLVRRRR